MSFENLARQTFLCSRKRAVYLCSPEETKEIIHQKEEQVFHSVTKDSTGASQTHHLNRHMDNMQPSQQEKNQWICSKSLHMM